MVAHRLIPDKSTLDHWVNDEQLTHAQIAQRIYTTTGHMVARSSVSAALSKYGLSKPTPRYSEEIPWRVANEHLKEYPVRMLRTLGRFRAGITLSQGDADRLASWLDKLQQDNFVVAYDPDGGFVYTPREDGDPVDVPIRVNPVRIAPQ